MYCNSCGRVIVGNGRFCTNCGSEVEIIGNAKSGEIDLMNNDRINSNLLLNKITNSESPDHEILPGEYITAREKVKRISEERVKKEIEFAKLQRSIVTANEVKQKNKDESTVEPRIIGEQEFTGSPEEVASKKKLSRKRKMFLTIGSYLTGIVVFVVCVGYLFWRFAPPGDSYKHNFVQWMSTNANGQVNEFLFDNMKLGDYYSPSKLVDYSGIYISRKKSSINKLHLRYQESQLSGYYISGDQEYKLKGYVTNKGALLLLESLNGLPTATITGKLFSIGYLTAERVEQLTGRKDILSLEKSVGR